jgi:hypothetical protein
VPGVAQLGVSADAAAANKALVTSRKNFLIGTSHVAREDYRGGE